MPPRHNKNPCAQSDTLIMLFQSVICEKSFYQQHKQDAMCILISVGNVHSAEQLLACVIV